MSQRPTVTEQAPAKLNLALAVGPRDGSGMHPICSWMVTVDLVDELTVTALPEDRLSRYAVRWHADAARRSEIDWAISRDLAVRAHLALCRHVGAELPIQMKLEKRIPVGGGLGGGSSDAAAMLRALDRLFDLRVGPEDLAAIGAALGSDVPFLLRGGSAVVSGRGEAVVPHEQPPLVHALLVFPEAICPTPRVYAEFDQIGGAALRDRAIEALARAGPGLPPALPAPEQLFNDLTEAAVRVAPELGPMMSGLSELAERPAHLSGSGSTIFVLCDDALHADSLVETVRQRLRLPAVTTRTWPVHEAITV